jgi:transposase
MTPPPSTDRQQKRQTLRRHGVLNPQPEAVIDPLFHDSDFFDPDDLVQVKYEMLRQVHVDNNSISESARAFGFSRPSFYQAQSAFHQDGVFGLLPHKRGPQGGHKLTDEVMEFVAQQRSADPSLTPAHLAEAIRKRFRLQVHPRSIQRRIVGQKKRR